MKRFLVSLAVLVMVITVTPATRAMAATLKTDELITHGTFESYSPACCGSWPYTSPFLQNYNAGGYSISTAMFHAGVKSLSYKKANTNFATFGNWLMDDGSGLPSDTAYDWSVWIYRTVPDTWASYTWKPVRVSALNSAGDSSMVLYQVEEAEWNAMPVGQWFNLSGTVTVPAGKAVINLRLGFAPESDSGNYYLDDVSIKLHVPTQPTAPDLGTVGVSDTTWDNQNYPWWFTVYYKPEAATTGLSVSVADPRRPGQDWTAEYSVISCGTPPPDTGGMCIFTAVVDEEWSRAAPNPGTDTAGMTISATASGPGGSTGPVTQERGFTYFLEQPPEGSALYGAKWVLGQPVSNGFKELTVTDFPWTQVFQVCNEAFLGKWITVWEGTERRLIDQVTGPDPNLQTWCYSGSIGPFTEADLGRGQHVYVLEVYDSEADMDTREPMPSGQAVLTQTYLVITAPPKTCHDDPELDGFSKAMCWAFVPTSAVEAYWQDLQDTMRERIPACYVIEVLDGLGQFRDGAATGWEQGWRMPVAWWDGNYPPGVAIQYVTVDIGAWSLVYTTTRMISRAVFLGWLITWAFRKWREFSSM